MPCLPKASQMLSAIAGSSRRVSCERTSIAT